MTLARTVGLVLFTILAATACRGGRGDAGADTGEDTGDASDLLADTVDDPDAESPDDPPVDAPDPGDDVSADADAEENGCIGEDPVMDVTVDEADAQEAVDAADEDVDEAEDVADVEDVAEDEADAAEDETDAADEDVLDAGETTAFACGDAFVDTRDGRTYATVLIGAQCWMAENLDAGSMISGATRQTNNGVVEKHCYGDDPANCGTYGGLYEWDEMMDYSPSDAANPSTTRGICPSGWHVPSDEEWKVLEVFLGMTTTEADMVNGWRGVGAGTALKVGGSSGYDALLAGRGVGGAFDLLGLNEYMYTSTEYGTNAWRRCLALGADTVGRWNTFPKSWGLSVRCVLD